jgi:hypothetical protein
MESPKYMTNTSPVHYLAYSADSFRWVIGKRELHCGDCFEIRIRGIWLGVRIEMRNSRWYLVGAPLDLIDLEGCAVRFYTSDHFPETLCLPAAS